MRVIIVLVLGFAAQLLFMPAAAHADPAPVRCRDVSNYFSTSHICQYPDGSIINCFTSGPGGPSCKPVPVQLAPGFWDQP